MALISSLLIGGAITIGVGFFGKHIADGIKEDKKRRQTPCLFQDGFTEEQFGNMVAEATKGIKRLKDYKIDGPFIFGTAISQSGLSEWKFRIDFNDYGHITGKYWIRSDNSDSSLPKVVADRIKERVLGVTGKSGER